MEARRLYAEEGNSYERIGQLLGVSPSTIAKYVKIDASAIPKEHITVRGKEHIDAVNKVKEKKEETRARTQKKKGIQKKEKLRKSQAIVVIV